MKITLNSLIFALLSLALARAETITMDCKPDTEGKFKVPGTEANEMRSCAWAGRVPDNKAERCAIDVVAFECPGTCEVPCQPLNFAPVEEVESGDDNTTSVVFIVGCAVAGVAVLALIAVAALKSGNDRDAIDELSRQSSLGLNANEDILLSMSGGGIPGPITPVPRHDSIETQDVQKRGTFDSCCEPC